MSAPIGSEVFGSDAILEKLTATYGTPEAKHWGTIMRYAEGGPDPLDGISVYEGHNPPHWHYVTFGFSELNDKRSPNKDVSGWGFELSFRLKSDADETSPPEWPVIMLQNLARYVFNNKLPFDHEHYIGWGGPITKRQPTQLEAIVFSDDPQLGEISTVNGRLKFLEAIAITADEHQFAADQGPDKLLAGLLAKNPLGVTDLDRGSIFAN